MKHIMALTLLVIMLASHAMTQSSDRFIRTLGNASKVYSAYQWQGEITLTERKDRDQPEENRLTLIALESMLIDSLQALDIAASELKPAVSTKSKSSNSKQTKFTLTLHDFTKVQRIYDLNIEGFNVPGVTYSFSPVPPEDEKELARLAIQDARRRAESLAREANQKVGRILNIEDTSTGCCGEIKDQHSPTATLTYHVKVTFQLKR